MKKIIFVDDEQLIRNIYSLIGQRIQTIGDYYFEVASAPKEVLARMEQDEFHILVTDFDMPTMDGFQLVSRAKVLWPELKCIVCSGNILPDNPDACFIFRKPFSLFRLINAITTLD